jgi:hypothetical protein
MHHLALELREYLALEQQEHLAFELQGGHGDLFFDIEHHLPSVRHTIAADP